MNKNMDPLTQAFVVQPLEATTVVISVEAEPSVAATR